MRHYLTTFLLVAMIMAIVSHTSKAKSSNAYSPPSSITVWVYHLRGDGSIDPSYTLCSSGDTSYGCTAISSYLYPYSTNPVTIPIETDYLLDVVPSEVLVEAFHPTAIQAQAIAARSYAYWHIRQGSTINNSNQFQVFVPYAFEALPSAASANFPDNPSNPCVSSNLNADQQIVCGAVAPRNYISYGSYPNDDLPAFTEYFADIRNRTVSGGQPYLIAVDDPISFHPDIVNDGHGHGMSQKGASRWARGNLSYNINRDLGAWSVRWTHAKQILTHYYTGVHIRDGNGTQLTSGYRWNALQINNAPTQVPPGHTSYVSVWVQNTGTASWFGSGGGGPIAPTHALSYRIYDMVGVCVANCDGTNRTPLDSHDEKDPGDDLWRTVPVHFPSNLMGPVVIRFDMVQLDALAQNRASRQGDKSTHMQPSATTAAVDFWFSDYGQGWYTQDTHVCVGGCVFLPFVGRQF